MIQGTGSKIMYLVAAFGGGEECSCGGASSDVCEVIRGMFLSTGGSWRGIPLKSGQNYDTGLSM